MTNLVCNRIRTRKLLIERDWANARTACPISRLVTKRSLFLGPFPQIDFLRIVVRHFAFNAGT